MLGAQRVVGATFMAFLLATLGIVVSMTGYKDAILEYLEQFNGWILSLGMFGPLALGLADLVAVVICFPFAASFEFAAGFLFGVVGGTIIIVFGKVSGAAIAFLLGRTLLHDTAHRILMRTNYFNQVHDAMAADCFKIAILMRLSPVPSWVINYSLALSPISFKNFVLATLFAGFPNIIKNVYGGSFMRSALTEEMSQLYWFLRIGTGCLTVLATILLTKYLHKIATRTRLN